MTAKVCSHFCPTNSNDIKLLSSPANPWEHVLDRMKLCISSACWEPPPCAYSDHGQISLRCSDKLLTSLRAMLQTARKIAAPMLDRWGFETQNNSLGEVEPALFAGDLSGSAEVRAPSCQALLFCKTEASLLQEILIQRNKHNNQD